METFNYKVPTQPTPEEARALEAQREARLSSGVYALEFFLGFTQRDPETQELGCKPDRPITPEIAEQYAPHLAAIKGTELVTAALGLSHTEFAQFIPLLDDLAQAATTQ